MSSRWSMRSQSTGVPLSTMNSTIVWEKLTRLHQQVCWWMVSLTLQTTRTVSALDFYPMSTATQQSRTPADILAKVQLTHSMLRTKSSLLLSVIALKYMNSFYFILFFFKLVLITRFLFTRGASVLCRRGSLCRVP